MPYSGGEVGFPRKKDRGAVIGAEASAAYWRKIDGLSAGAPAGRVVAVPECGRMFDRAAACYMEKLTVGPEAADVIDITVRVAENIRRVAAAKHTDVSDVTVCVLDRPRHEKLVRDIREAGARIHLIPDGDLSAGIAAAVRGTGVHCVMGTGGAPEGVLTAAAMRCLNGEIQARLIPKDAAQEERIRSMGIRDLKKIHSTQDLAPGNEIIFAATGVTDGSLLHGVRFFGDGMRTHSLVMTLSTRSVRLIESVHLARRPDVQVRF